ncbi:MAG TPA: hypothetical protein VN887_19490 [Candidatus Angelobacter sp.]|nr:hypothetical protein [Candidatus Angelobacter sp.]
MVSFLHHCPRSFSDAINSSAFLWQSDLGYKDLRYLLPTGSQWAPISAEAINDSGVIVGWGYNNAVSETYVHGFLMTP